MKEAYLKSFKIGMLLLALSFVLYSCSGEDEEEIPETSDVKIRPILNEEFILINFPIMLLDRSTCGIYGNVTTDDEGVFTLDNYDGRDVILFVEESDNQVHVGTFDNSDIQSGIVNDIAMTESIFLSTFLTGTGIGGNAIFSTDDDLIANYELIVPDYPMDKVVVEVLDDNSTFLFEVNLAADGRVNFELPITEPGEHVLRLIFKGLGDVVILETAAVYNITMAFDANLTATVDPCNTIVLSWDAYTFADFNAYLLSFADPFDETGSCDQLFANQYIEDPNVTTFSLDDYATTDMLCFSLEVLTSSGTSEKNLTSIEQPYGFSSSIGSDINQSTLLSNGSLYFDFQSGDQLCYRDPNTDEYFCNNYNLNNAEIVFKGEVNDVFHYVTWDGSYRLLNGENELQGFITASSISPQLFVTNKGIGITIDNNELNRFKLFDFMSGEIGSNSFETIGSYSAFINAPGDNQFGIISYEDDFINLTIKNKLTLYTITDINTITEGASIDLDFPFLIDRYSVSPSGRYLALPNGHIIDLEAPTPQVFNPLPDNLYEVFASDTDALFVDGSQGKRFLYNYANGSIMDSDICGGRAVGITTDQGIFVNKFSQIAVLGDVLYPK